MKYCLFFFACIISCKSEPKSHSKSAFSHEDSTEFSKYPYIAHENDISKLVTQLETSDCVYFGGIGISGEESLVYDCYKRLLEIAQDSLWLKFSYSKNPVVRMYAYEALLSKRSPDKESVRARLKRDTAIVCWVSDDVEFKLPLGYLVSAAKSK